MLCFLILQLSGVAIFKSFALGITQKMGNLAPFAAKENAAEIRVRSFPVVVALTRLEPLLAYE